MVYPWATLGLRLNLDFADSSGGSLIRLSKNALYRMGEGSLGILL